MGALDQLETFLQELVERPAWLLAPRRLRPIEIASALTRELESKALRLADRIVIPSRYEVLVADEDRARLETDLAVLEREMAQYVRRLAVERDLSLPEAAEVRIRRGSDVQPGQVVVHASFPAEPEDAFAAQRSDRWRAPHGGEARGFSGGAGTEATALRTPGHASRASLSLLGMDGRQVQQFAVDRPSVTLGRRSDNDIALADVKISRYHARVDRVGDEYFLTDLQSTNGTRVNGAAVSGWTRLRSGDVIELGLQRLRFDG